MMNNEELKESNLSVNINVFLNEKPEKKQDLINEIISQVKDNEKIGFAGWKDKDGLRENLNFNIEKEDIAKSNVNSKLLLDKINKVLQKANSYLDEEIFIYVFPTNSDFTKNKLKGVTGYCPWRNVVYIYIHSDCDLENLEKVLAHELAHSVSNHYNGFNTNISKGLVMEGLAENFVEMLVGEPDKNIVDAITENQGRKILIEIKPLFEKEDNDKYPEIFYGSGKYPEWVGYSIGYYLVKNYIKDKKDFDWNELLRINPAEIEVN